MAEQATYNTEEMHIRARLQEHRNVLEARLISELLKHGDKSTLPRFIEVTIPPGNMDLVLFDTQLDLFTHFVVAPYSPAARAGELNPPFSPKR